MRRAAAVIGAAALLGGRAEALFQRKTDQQAAEGAPTVQDLEIQTYRDLPIQGRLPAAAGEGELTYALAEEPGKGTVALEGDTFTYTPEEGITGTDRFTYTVSDSQGRTSAPATVTVRIEKPRSGVCYSDTQGSPAAAAAQYLAEAGIFTGTKVGEQYRFEPDRPVTREEFLAMVLETADREVPQATMTGFCDDASIPAWSKSYAAAGVAEGLIQGRSTAQGAAFQGEEPITLTQAATMLNRALALGDVDLDVWFADRAAAPSWAAQAVGNMEALSVLSVGSFGGEGLEQPVTRADAARMLWAADVLMAGEAPESGLLSWLR